MRSWGLALFLFGEAFAVAVAACSTDEFSAQDGGVDAAPDARTEVGPVDAEAGAVDGDAGALALCDPSTPFQTKEIVVELNDSQRADFRIALDAVETHAVYARLSRVVPDASYLQPELWYAARPSNSGPFGLPTLASGINAANGSTLDPSLSRDGLTLYFASYRAGTTSNIDIFTATRGSVTAGFTNPTLVAVVSSNTEEDLSPYLVEGRAIYFARGTQVTADLYRAPIQGGNIGAPVALAELNSIEDERYPVVSDDELTIYFSRRGNPGGQEIMIARRASTSVPFGPATVVTGLSGGQFTDEYPAWMSPDQCVLYYNSTAVGFGDVMRATRSK